MPEVLSSTTGLGDLRSLAVPAIAAGLFAVLLYHEYGPQALGHIPVVGGSRVPILSLLGAIRYLWRAREVLEEGCKKYNGHIFRVPQVDQWAVIVTSPELIDEVRQFPEDKLSVARGLGEVTAITYVFGTRFLTSPYPAAILHQYLNRQLGDRVSIVYDEMLAAFDDLILTQSTNDWVGVLGFSTVVKIIARTTNRTFVGLPACQNSGFLDIVTNVTIDVFKVRLVINLIPSFLKPYVAWLISPTPRNIRRCKPYLHSLIEERILMLKNAHALKQECLMHAIIDELAPLGYKEDDLICALFVLEFGAIHTTAIGLTYALFQIAENPEYARQLREEAQSVLEKEGGVWTKEAIAKLRRADSLLKEVQRLSGGNATSLFRKAMTDVTLSDGTRIPKGTLVLAASRHVQLDENNYPDPEVFRPWRFVQEDAAIGSVSQNLTTPRPDYLPFGMGKHACPGRFFAALEMKLLLAHMVMTYDIQFENGGPQPPGVWRGASVFPDRATKVYFRKRSV